ncbi:MAG: cytochrome c nitrite reductase small subunit [Planctomycetota bacterium]|jgi:cytochrome c nitrite reductase small subunit
MLERLKALVLLSGLPRPMKITIYLMAGIIIGMAVVIARIANAVSYLSDSPETCINCHVMTDAYATWQRGSHSRMGVCIDCHVPHDNMIAKYAFKAHDGLKHSYVFTMHKEPQVLELSKLAVTVVHNNCIRCHSNQFDMIRLAQSSERLCWDCHNNIHGSARSLSSSPHVLRPQLPAAGLKWFKKGDQKDD